MMNTIKNVIHDLLDEPLKDPRHQDRDATRVPGELPTELLVEFGYVPVAGRHRSLRELRRLGASDMDTNGWSAN